MRIVVTKRSGDFHACIDGHPEHWAAGKTEEAAVMDLIRSNRDTFGIQVVLPHETALLGLPDPTIGDGQSSRVFGEIVTDTESTAVRIRLSLAAGKGSAEEPSGLRQMDNLVARLHRIVMESNTRINFKTQKRNTPHGDRVDQIDIGIYV